MIGSHKNRTGTISRLDGALSMSQDMQAIQARN
jgi:hypothetical protein